MGGHAHEPLSQIEHVGHQETQQGGTNADEYAQIQYHEDIREDAVYLAVILVAMPRVGCILIDMAGVRADEIRQFRESEDYRQNKYAGSDARIRNPKAFVGRLNALARIKENAADNGTQNPTDAVERLGQVDSRGRIFRRAENGRIGVCDCLQKRQSHGDETHTQEKRPKLCNVGGRNEPQTACRNHHESGDNTALVTKLLGKHAGGDRHEKVSDVVSKLNPGGICLV